MAKRLNLKLPRVITSFQICRSKNHSSLFDTPLSRFNPKAIDINDPKLPSPPPSTPDINHSSKLKGEESFKLNSEEFSCDSLEFAKKQDLDKASGLSEAVENNQETQIYLFSGSFRYDTSIKFDKSMGSSTSEKCNENDNSNNINSHQERKEMKMRRNLRGQIWKSWSKMNLWRKKERPQASVVKRLMPCMEDGKMRECVAVVKKSEDPYEDFKRSMLEMISEKQMFEAKDLEELLQCFLSLNSRQYHGVIVEAFSEIWELLFRNSTEDGF